MGTLVSSQKLRILGFKKFFGLPGGFSLGMIAPLHLKEITSLSPSNPSLVILSPDVLDRLDQVRVVDLPCQFPQWEREGTS